MLRIGERDLREISAQAIEEYPHECCGIFTVGAADEVVQVQRCKNIQQEKHQENPRDFPRDARTAYLIDPQELYQIISGAEKAGGQVVGFYHSHVDCDAYFSAEDKRRAMTFGDEPDYPEAAYLVLSVWGENGGRKAREVVGHKCFVWDGKTAEFAETELQVVD